MINKVKKKKKKQKRSFIVQMYNSLGYVVE